MNEKKLRIGFQGEKGAYSSAAIDALYPEGTVKKAAYKTSYAVVEALKESKINFGLLPIENSIIGNITHTYDLLVENKLQISKEVIIPIHHSFLVVKGMKAGDIKKIYSHPAAIAQCEVFLRKFEHTEILPTYDTAGSARMISEKKLFDAAAIASASSAELYDLEIIQRNIEDYPHNQTRFVLISGEAPLEESICSKPCKVSAVFDTLDKPGMLHHCLAVFDKHKVNLTQLSSRPSRSEPWKYHFFIDLEGKAGDDNIAAAFDEIGKMTGFIYIIGSYQKYDEH